jgi:uncharacterized DUF497 family protein
MNGDAFEWDENKAARNIAAHGISFEVACEVFDDELAIERPDERGDYGEDRTNITGMVKGRLLTVTYTLRGYKIRLISARMAEPYERRWYHEKTR